MSNKLIAFIGVMGCGKTTAAQLLSRKSFTLSEEDHINNAFLSNYYDDMPRWGFHSQMYFLVNKIKQYEQINQALTEGNVVQDFPLYLDVAFAKTVHKLGNMSEPEWSLYYEAFCLLDKQLRQPDLMVYLKVKPKTALERIKIRGREFESGVTEEYLVGLQDSIEQLIDENKGKSRYMEINADDINLVADHNDIDTFVAQVLK